MRAVVADVPGDSSVLRVAELPEPAPGPGQYLVRVHAAGVNPVDWKLRRNAFPRPMRATFPWIPGCECCGVVVRAGAGARRFAADESVIGVLDPRVGGMSAEFAVLDEAALLPRPARLSPIEAAALPTAALTAIIGLRLGHARAGAHVIINGAAGGVGHLAVQFAKVQGLRVTAICSARNREFVRELGADTVLARDEQDPLREADPCDVFFDVPPGLSFWQARRLLFPGGTYVTTMPGAGPAVAAALAPVFGRRARFVVFHPRAGDVDVMLRLAESGTIRVVVEASYPLPDLAAAHDRSEAGAVRGKLVVVP